MSTASRREVHRRPRLGRRTWKLADNLNPTDIRVYAGCFTVPSCRLVLTLGPGVVSHLILAGNRGQTRSGALLLTRPLLGCHLTVEDVWRVDKEDKAKLKLLTGKLSYRSVEYVIRLSCPQFSTLHLRWSNLSLYIYSFYISSVMNFDRSNSLLGPYNKSTVEN